MTALAVALVAAPAPASGASTRDRIEAVRDAIGDTAQRWFDSQAEVARLDAEIAVLEHHAADAREQARLLAGVASARAVELYMSESASISPLLDGDGALDSARRAELLGRANDDAEEAIDALGAAADELETHLADLEERRDELARATEELTAQEEALDAQLAALRDQAAAEASARTERPSARPASTGDGESAATLAAPAPPRPVSGTHPQHDHPFLVCTRERESGGDYTAVNPAGYYGAYQFAPTTWDVTASRAGRLDLVGVLPSRAGVYDQDDLAWVLYQWQGNRPWNGRC